MLVAELRPDVVTRTGVVDPFGANRLVQRAQNAINPFINSVRGRGPDVTSPPPAVEVAAAASAVANQLRRGKGARVAVGTVRADVSPRGQTSNLKGLSGGLGDAQGSSIIGAIISAAQQLAAGRPVLITSGYGSVVVSPTGQVTSVGGPTAGSSASFSRGVVAQMAPVAAVQAQLATQRALRNVPR